MLDYTPLEPDIQIVKKSPVEQRKLRDFSQTLLDNLQEANRANNDIRRMKLLIETLWMENVENNKDVEKKIDSLYLKYQKFSDFSYEYVRYLLSYKEDYKAGLNLAKEILERDEKMRYKIEDEIFMEIAVQVVVGNFQEYILYGLHVFWKDMQRFLEKYRADSNDSVAIKNYNTALEYIKENMKK